MSIQIREATKSDFEQIWNIFHSIVSTGTTYAYDPDTQKGQAFRIWMESPKATYVAVENCEILGTYYIKANQPGLGSHVCNCGYMVSEEARGKGIATSMCKHSQVIALELGFKAMQFNLIVSTNAIAVRLWKKLGFEIVGKLPQAFNHKSLGFVDAFVMYKWLDS